MYLILVNGCDAEDDVMEAEAKVGDALCKKESERSVFFEDSMRCDEAGKLFRENIFAISRGTKIVEFKYRLKQIHLN